MNSVNGRGEQRKTSKAAAPPRGFRDVLPTEARELRAIERDLAETFEAYGYVPLDPPMVERSNGGSVLAGDRLIRFLDRDGELVALRPDITTAVARLVAKRYADATGALRLSYFAPVFRESPAMLGTERQYIQAGVELVGASGPLADAEALALLAESLDRAGLRGQTIEVGHVGLVRALFEEIEDESRADVLALLRSGDQVGAFERARAAGMSVAAITRARQAFAARGFEALDALRLSRAGELHEVIALAREMFAGDRVVPNLAIIPALPYYTGIVFEALRADQGFPIAAGGRYDLLLSAFGAPRPATGFAIDVPRLHLALFASGWRPRSDRVLVALAPGDATATARAATALRSRGVAVAIGAVAESAGLTVVNTTVPDAEHVSLDGRELTPEERATTLEVGRPVRIALAQGLLLDDALAALAAIGHEVASITNGSRRLLVNAGDVEVVRARPSDIATYVERGAADLGIVGKDVLAESGARVLELVDLGFGACRFVVAAPRAAMARALDDYRHLGSLRVATKYPNVAERYFRERGIAVEIVKVAGSAELAPQVGLSDWIVDLVATGATLAANDLAIVEEILPSTARLVANPSAYHARRDEIAPIVEQLAAWAASRRSVVGTLA